MINDLIINACVLVGGLCIGFILGSLIFYIKNKQPRIGRVRVDQSDKTEQPYLFLELYYGDAIERIKNSTSVEFDVLVEDYIKEKNNG